jgi:hypothetical protein
MGQIAAVKKYWEIIGCVSAVDSNGQTVPIHYHFVIAEWREKQAWFPWFRVYGPEKAIMDKSWKLPDIEKAK